MRTRALDLVVDVRYYGYKARDFYAGSTKAMDILREDLVVLKLPYPKRENTIFKALPDGEGECSFMWSAVPFESILHKHLSTRICGKDPEGARRRLLRDLSICRLSLRESPAGTVKMDRQRNEWRTWGGNQAEAQMLLNDMALALKMPKSEPIEPTLPDVPRTFSREQDRDSVASSLPSPPLAPAQVGIRRKQNGQLDSPMSISSSKHTTPRRPIKVLVQSPVIPSPSLHPESSDSIPPGLTFSTRYSNQTPDNTQFPPFPTRKRSRSDSPPFQPRRPPPDLSFLQSTNGDTSKKVEGLQFELHFVRDQIETSLGREASIVSELQALGHSAPPRETPQEKAMREKLQALESQLQAETRMRIEAETALSDFQRECREPFLVPALYDVVESISRLTTQVVGKIQHEAGAVG